LVSLDEQASYEESMAALEPDAIRADELLNGITWQIARDPLNAHAAAYFPFRVAVAVEPSTPCFLVVFYTFEDGDTTALLWWVDRICTDEPFDDDDDDPAVDS
jgi:hypothetical protein